MFLRILFGNLALTIFRITITILFTKLAKISGNIRNYVNASNELSGANYNMEQSVEYEKLENARLLSSNEYTYNAVLGFISLNQSLNNDEVLGVAYQYAYNGQTYQVGELSTDGFQVKMRCT